MVATPLCLHLSWQEPCLDRVLQGSPMRWFGCVAFGEYHMCLPSKKRGLVDLKSSEVRSNTCTWKIIQGEHKWKSQSSCCLVAQGWSYVQNVVWFLPLFLPQVKTEANLDFLYPRWWSKEFSKLCWRVCRGVFQSLLLKLWHLSKYFLPRRESTKELGFVIE